MEINKNQRIQELPQHVTDKIAAGEVIDRPLSIVKELVENSIDSGADSIIVEFKNGGKTYIRITDNGSGIDSRDIELAFKRHATSKIETAQDLERIQTLGFRGEALSSICAVSKTELITKTSSSIAGLRIRFSGGLVLENSEIGCPQGTTVIVTDLFFNTPARLKFMKSESAETTMIIDFISKIALAYPAIKIRLLNNSNIVFSTTGKGNLYENILTVFNTDLGTKLIHIQDSDNNYIIEAYISIPSFTQASRKNQIFFINGRSISSKIIEQGIAAAYREKISDNRYPAAFVFFRLPPNQLDVNIHPNKREVRLADEKAVSAFIEKSLLKGLAGKFAIPELTGKSIFHIPTKATNEKTSEQVDIRHIFVAKREPDTKFAYTNSEEKSDHNGPWLRESKTEEEPIFYQPEVFDVLSLKITGAIFDTYITAVDEDYFYLIDQHAAHERVFYEALMAAYNNRPIGIQSIMVPFMISTSCSVSEINATWLTSLRSMGYDLELFGPKIYRVKGIPMFMSLGEAQSFLEDFMDNVLETTDFQDLKKIEKIISHACKSAVKAHDKLDIKEMQQLLIDLSKTDKPGSCPHGRPVYVKLRKYEIEKLFKRI